MTFDKTKAFKIARIEARKGAYRDVTPFVQIEHYPNDEVIGPIILTVDLKHDLNPAESKPQAFVHLFPTQSLRLAVALLKAYLRCNPMAQRSDIPFLLALEWGE